MLIMTIGLFAWLILSCDDSSSPSIGSASGNLRVLLTDAPMDLSNVEAVNVTIDEVLVYPAMTDSEEPVPISLSGTDYAGEGATLNLLELVNGEKALLGEAIVDPGFYEKVRMNISYGELLIDDDGEDSTEAIVEELKIPSGKVGVETPFEIQDGYTTFLTLDFDAAKSVHVNENPNKYILRPVINHVGTELVANEPSS
jgi:hypothetical protein